MGGSSQGTKTKQPIWEGEGYRFLFGGRRELCQSDCTVLDDSQDWGVVAKPWPEGKHSMAGGGFIEWFKHSKVTQTLPGVLGLDMSESNLAMVYENEQASELEVSKHQPFAWDLP